MATKTKKLTPITDKDKREIVRMVKKGKDNVKIKEKFPVYSMRQIGAVRQHIVKNHYTK